ncbi:glutamate-rich protein 5 [Mauremys reevesii]|uniref:glutamate-rich protein 5 n=1 Tax=Mauremys reevesii TaxID=260615 RepID=UPI00193F4340|nr:glutamate-rich protein 5 [Mauremys reevesii]
MTKEAGTPVSLPTYLPFPSGSPLRLRSAQLRALALGKRSGGWLRCSYGNGARAVNTRAARGEGPGPGRGSDAGAVAAARVPLAAPLRSVGSAGRAPVCLARRWARGAMGCSSSAQTQDSNRPAAKPSDTNGLQKCGETGEKVETEKHSELVSEGTEIKEEEETGEAVDATAATEIEAMNNEE